MHALITGASGFVGRVLHRHLIDSGDHVTGLSRAKGSPDITDRDGLRQTIGEASPDVVYHLAAQAHVPTSWADPISTLRTNVEGTQNVLDAAHEASVGRVVVIGSAEVYGSLPPELMPLSEDTPLNPVSPYAASKVAAEAIASQSHLGRGQDVVRVRAFNHIGPGQQPNFVCAGLAHRIAVAERDRHRCITVGSLAARRDFTDVRDVVQAYRLIAELGDAGDVYNVCSGVDTSIQDVADYLVELAHVPIGLVVDTGLIRTIDTPIVRGDHQKLTAKTRWQPQISLEESLSDILQDARERLDEPTT